MEEDTVVSADVPVNCRGRRFKGDGTISKVVLKKPIEVLLTVTGRRGDPSVALAVDCKYCISAGDSDYCGAPFSKLKSGERLARCPFSLILPDDADANVR